MSYILITNDDGIDSPGLHALADAFQQGHTTAVMAPQRNCSGAAQSITLDRPLTVSPHGKGWSVDGTPCDCAHLALNGALGPARFEGVVSGINHGSNLGEDVMYSGTVGAAREANLSGVNSLAVSLVTRLGDAVLHWDSAAWYARLVWTHYATGNTLEPWFLNLNVPNLPLAKIKGLILTQLSTRPASKGLVNAVSPRGQKSFWIGAFGEPVDAFGDGLRLDHMAVGSGWVSLTPLSRSTMHPAAELQRGMVEAMNRHIYMGEHA